MGFPLNQLNTNHGDFQINQAQIFEQTLNELECYLPNLNRLQILNAVKTYGLSNTYLHASRYGRLPF